jgi:hypothetical protein
MDYVCYGGSPKVLSTVDKDPSEAKSWITKDCERETVKGVLAM